MSNNIVNWPVLKEFIIIASRVSKTRDSSRTRVLETQVKGFLRILAGQKCQVEPRGYRVCKTRYPQVIYLPYSQTQTHSRKFQTQVTPFLSALSNSLSLSHSFIKQIRGPNLKQIHSHCAKGTLNAVLNAFSTPFVAHRAEGTLHFF